MRNPFDTAPPAYRSVAPGRRWSGALSGLRPVLEREAEQLAPSWAWRIVPGDTSVAMRLFEGRLQGRIARAVAPSPRSQWEGELARFQRHLGWEGWGRTDVSDALGVATIFTSGVPRCACGGEMDAAALLYGGGKRCSTCRMREVRRA